MSMRSILEINHDMGPESIADQAKWLGSMRAFYASARAEYLPHGVKLLAHVHHTDRLADGGVIRELSMFRDLCNQLAPGVATAPSAPDARSFVEKARQKNLAQARETTALRRLVGDLADKVPVTDANADLLLRAEHARTCKTRTLGDVAKDVLATLAADQQKKAS